MRSYRHGPLTLDADWTIASSVRATSAVPNTPMVGAATGGSGSEGPSSRCTGVLARYQLRAAGRAPGSGPVAVEVGEGVPLAPRRGGATYPAAPLVRDSVAPATADQSQPLP